MKYINADELKEVILELYDDNDQIIRLHRKKFTNIIDELSEEREDVDVEKLAIQRYGINEAFDSSGNDIMEPYREGYVEGFKAAKSLKQPKPLKVAIKGDGTEEYSKAIFQYFGKHTIKGQHDIGSFVCEVYYYIENDNIVFCPFLPKNYTEISLKDEESWLDKDERLFHKEEEKIVTDNSKVNTYLLNRVEELEKELTYLKLKLKELSK